MADGWLALQIMMTGRRGAEHNKHQNGQISFDLQSMQEDLLLTASQGNQPTNQQWKYTVVSERAKYRKGSCGVGGFNF